MNFKQKYLLFDVSNNIGGTHWEQTDNTWKREINTYKSTKMRELHLIFIEYDF